MGGVSLAGYDEVYSLDMMKLLVGVIWTLYFEEQGLLCAQNGVDLERIIPVGFRRLCGQRKEDDWCII